MTISKSTKSYINTSQKIRTIIRQMINGGYCLVISENSSTFSFIKSILTNNNITTNLANFTYSSRLIKKDANHIISIVFDIDKNSYMKAMNIIKMIEKDYLQIPYIILTDNSDVYSWISNRYPKVNIMIKEEDMSTLIDALGVANCA